MALLAFDGASPFSLTAAQKAGGILITGYLVGHPGGYAPINKARVAQIRKLGMGFLPNWERGAGYLVTCGRAGGLAAGREAVASLRALGVPDDGTVACAFSWDVNIHPSLYPQCVAVAKGIIAGLAGHYRFTAYGQGGLIDHFAAAGLLGAKGWLSASASFPGFNPASLNVGLVQKTTTPVAGTDRNIVTNPTGLHAWWPAGSTYVETKPPITPPHVPTPTPAPPSTTQDANVIIFRATGHYQWPVLVTGSTSSVLTSHTSVLALQAAGARVVELAPADFARIRKGAVK